MLLKEMGNKCIEVCLQLVIRQKSKMYRARLSGPFVLPELCKGDRILLHLPGCEFSAGIKLVELPTPSLGGITGKEMMY